MPPEAESGSDRDPADRSTDPAATTWHLLTGEYPPARGGVAAYSRLMARGLADRGAEVHVWCPENSGPAPHDQGVVVHPDRRGWRVGRLASLGKQLDAFSAPRKLLVQWVPHAFGYKAMNLPFCLWLASRARGGDEVYVMVHEAHVAFGESLKTDLVAAVNRLMDIALLRAARRVWVGTPEWADRLRPYRLGRPLEFEFLPVPSNIERTSAPDAYTDIRARYGFTDREIIGHFGTYGTTAPLLDELLPPLLHASTAPRLLLLGHGADAYARRFRLRHPEVGDSVAAPEGLNDRDLSAHMLACDLFVQPYPDGLTCRRGSAMAVVAHGRPLVSTRARYTEQIWEDEGAAALSDVTTGMEGVARTALDLLADPARRKRLGEAADRLYDRLFDIRHSVDAVAEAGRAPGGRGPGR